VIEPQRAQQEILDALHDHFDRTEQPLSAEEISEMTAIDLTVVENALRVLHKANRIEGIMVAEYQYPVKVTGIVYGV
jgi:predicted transcriptional regulator